MSRGANVRFRVLGAWEVTGEGGPVVIPPGQLRTLLASLLVSAGRAVPLDTLAARVWPERMPARVTATVHTYVARLRRLLGQEVIQTRSGRYQLAVAPKQIDLWVFRELLRQAGAADDPHRELDLLRQALALWRGRPFAGMVSIWLDREVLPHLTDEWFDATERRIDLEMCSENPGSQIGELRELVRSHPTRESLWLRLIDALHRSGRRAEALDAYQEVRGVLTNELGMEPGDALQRIHREVLLDGANGTTTGRDLLDRTDDAVAGTEPVAAPVAEVVPARQLPHDVATFSGRAELTQLRQLTATIELRGRQLTHIVAIEGAPGIGKTTLAVHWAHQVAAAYPDLQLYLNLRGFGPGEPMTSSAAAETLLRGLGVHSDMIPSGADERAGLLRSTLAGRRVLLLLDNARDAHQVRPLLPAADSLVVVTSRNRLRGLSIRDGAHRITLGPLPPHEALVLLGAATGRAWVADERDAATLLVEICGGLPLALAIVAERAQRAGGLTDVVHALMDDQTRLEVFRDGAGDPHADLWAALSWSYRTLSADAAAMFRRLGLYPGDDISPDAAAALAGMPVRRARRALDQLVAAHLLQQHHLDRYELHDLVRWYANEQAEEDETPGERSAAACRVLDWYLHAAVAAENQLPPHRRRHYLDLYGPQVEPPEFADAGAAAAWLEREYHNLRAVIRWADAAGFGGRAWRMLMSTTRFFERRSVAGTAGRDDVAIECRSGAQERPRTVTAARR